MDTDPETAPTIPDIAYRERVRAYYDATNALYLAYLGSTIQATTVLGVGGKKEDVVASNLYLAAQAGIQPGQRILDAGCGVCGPAVDIVQAIEAVTIDAITISPLQAQSARKRILDTGTAHRVRVYVGDYHYLPFPSQAFDIVLFFESSGCSYSLSHLFAEIFRVLRPGGRLYIKDIFKQESDLSDHQRQQLAIFDRLFVQRTPGLGQMVEEIARAGFQDIQSRDLADVVSQQHWIQALGKFECQTPELTAFGKLHYYPFDDLPILCGEVKARKAGGHSI